MDEWFINLEVKDGAVQGLFRVPADQAGKLEESRLRVLADGASMTCHWTVEGEDEDGRVKVRLDAQPPRPYEKLTIAVPPGLLDDNQSLVGFLKIEGQEPTTVLVPHGKSADYLIAKEQNTVSLGDFFKLGVTHIVEGYDHLLFLFCLLIAGGTIRHFLVVVTSFTVGHSITLGLSILGYISLPSTVTETAIALSIVIAALSNIPWLDKTHEKGESPIRSRGLMAAGFGLIHGLGFAGALREIGIEGSGVVKPLFGFNLGVEAGQLVLVAIFFPLLMAVNKWGKKVPFLKGCSYLAAVIGSYWVLERLGLLG